MLTTSSKKLVLVDPNIIKIMSKTKSPPKENSDITPTTTIESNTQINNDVVEQTSMRNQKKNKANNLNRYSRPPSAEISNRNNSSSKNLSSTSKFSKNYEINSPKQKSTLNHFSLSHNNFFNYFAYKSMKKKQNVVENNNIEKNELKTLGNLNGFENSIKKNIPFISPKNNMMRRLTINEKEKQFGNINNENIMETDDQAKKSENNEENTTKLIKNKYLNNIINVKKNGNDDNKENNTVKSSEKFIKTKSPSKGKSKISTLMQNNMSPLINKNDKKNDIILQNVPITQSQDIGVDNNKVCEPLQKINNIVSELNKMDKNGDYSFLKNRLQELEEKIGDLKCSIDFNRSSSIQKIKSIENKESFVEIEKNESKNLEENKNIQDRPSINAVVSHISIGKTFLNSLSDKSKEKKIEKNSVIQVQNYLGKYPRSTTNAEIRKKTEIIQQEKINKSTQNQTQNKNSSKKLKISINEEPIPEEPQIKNNIVQLHSSRMINRTESNKPISIKNNLYYISNVVTSYFKPLKLYEDNCEANYFTQLCQEHLLQTFQSLHLSKTILEGLDNSSYLEKSIILPRKEIHKERKTLIFDLDETLVHCNENLDLPADIILPITFPNGQKIEVIKEYILLLNLIKAGINVRPYTKEILKDLSQYYEIVVFTASHSCYANVVLDFLDSNNEFIHHRMFRENCISSKEGMFIKDLRVIKNRDINDMIIVDNAAYSFAFQPENGIPILPFYDFKADKELLHLAQYLKDISISKNIIETNRKTFKLENFVKYEDLETLIEKELKEYIF